MILPFTYALAASSSPLGLLCLTSPSSKSFSFYNPAFYTGLAFPVSNILMASVRDFVYALSEIPAINSTFRRLMVVPLRALDFEVRMLMELLSDSFWDLLDVYFVCTGILTILNVHYVFCNTVIPAPDRRLEIKGPGMLLEVGGRIIHINV